MEAVLRQIVTVQEGGIIQICSPELIAGTQAEVLILPQASAIDESMEWSDEDIRDLTRYSLQRADASMNKE